MSILSTVNVIYSFLSFLCLIWQNCNLCSLDYRVLYAKAVHMMRLHAGLHVNDLYSRYLHAYKLFSFTST